MLSENRKRALVLSGGGGRGAYHVGVLRFLEEHDWLPDVVVGTSIGAVNGAAIASGHNAHSLWALWKRLKTNKVQKLHLNPLDGYFQDTSPLRDTLQEEGWINFDRINSEKAAVHLRITATEVTTGQLHIFGNSADTRFEKVLREPIGIDHIIASCSIPIVYPRTSLHGKFYWDGAVVANTPIGAAIAAGAEEVVVVIMTPWEKESRSAAEPGNLLEAITMTLEWALLASFQADLKLFRVINKLAKLGKEVERLQSTHPDFVQQNMGGMLQVLQTKYHELPEPIIVAPQEFIPLQQIVQYTGKGHDRVYRMGYEDARRAWRGAGRVVEGEG